MAQAVRFLFEECLHPFQVCAVNRQLHIARQFAHVVDERVTARRREQTTEWLGGGPLTRPVLMDLLLDLVTGARVLREDEPSRGVTEMVAEMMNSEILRRNLNATRTEFIVPFEFHC